MSILLEIQGVSPYTGKRKEKPHGKTTDKRFTKTSSKNLKTNERESNDCLVYKEGRLRIL